jgi:hypothetical protein
MQICKETKKMVPTKFIVEVTNPQELCPETLIGGQGIYANLRAHIMEL